MSSGFAMQLHLSASNELREMERQVERLAGVQAGIAHRFVPAGEILAADRFGSAEALRHVVARQFDVDTPGPRVVGAARLEEAANLGHDIVEVPRLVTTFVHESVP